MSITINNDASMPVGPSGGGDYIPTSEKGAANGVATLGSDGLVPTEQLPASGGGVTSVNGETGDVTLNAAGVGALATTDKGNTTGKVPAVNGGYLLGGNMPNGNTGFSPNTYPDNGQHYANFIAGNAYTLSTATSYSSGVQDCIVIGPKALFAYKGGQGTIAIGTEALYNYEGYFNITPDGSYNTALGYNAGRGVKYGNRNTIIGPFATNNGSSSYSLTNSTVVGSQALASYSADIDNVTALGNGANVTGSNQVQLGNSSTTVYAYGAVQDRSDARDKADIADSDLGLDFINLLQPRQWVYDYRDDYIAELFPPLNRDDYESDEAFTAAVVDQNAARQVWMSSPVKDGSHKRTRPHFGLVAQELKEVLDAAGVDFGGLQHHSVNGGQDVWTIGYMELIAPLIKSVQELSAKVKALENQST